MTPRHRHKLADAAAALDAGRAHDALALAEAVLRDLPDSPAARLLQARARIALHQPADTLASLDALEHYHADQRDRPDVAMLRLDALRAAGSLTLALRLADRLATQYPDDPRPHRAAYEVALQLTRQDRAVAALREVVRLCPSDAQAKRTLAQLVESTNPDEAIRLLAGDAEACGPARRARLLVAARRWPEAQDMYRQALRSSPQDATLLHEAGRLADDLGEDELAIARLTGARAWSALGDAHLHGGRLTQAGRAYWRAIRSGGGASVRDWTGLKMCAIESGHRRAADRAGMWLRRHASREERQRALGEMWPHVAQAIALGRARAAGTPVQHEAPSPLRGLLRQAAATLLRQTRRHPRRADVHYHLAVCHDALEHRADAEHSVGRALQLNPRYVAASQLAVRIGAHRLAA
mgnify:CR=1 FL=1